MSAIPETWVHTFDWIKSENWKLRVSNTFNTECWYRMNEALLMCVPVPLCFSPLALCVDVVSNVCEFLSVIVWRWCVVPSVETRKKISSQIEFLVFVLHDDNVDTSESRNLLMLSKSFTVNRCNVIENFAVVNCRHVLHRKRPVLVFVAALYMPMTLTSPKMMIGTNPFNRSENV